MKFGGICITTDNAPRLAAFYKTVFQIEPCIEGSHYGFGEFAVWDSGDVVMAEHQNIWLQCFDTDIDTLYKRLLHEIPDIVIISPPERKPWGGVFILGCRSRWQQNSCCPKPGKCSGLVDFLSPTLISRKHKAMSFLSSQPYVFLYHYALLAAVVLYKLG